MFIRDNFLVISTSYYQGNVFSSIHKGLPFNPFYNLDAFTVPPQQYNVARTQHCLRQSSVVMNAGAQWVALSRTGVGERRHIHYSASILTTGRSASGASSAFHYFRKSRLRSWSPT